MPPRPASGYFLSGLAEAGYEFFKPRGAFYLFPKAPGGDDLACVARLKEENILAVPGRGFAGRAISAWPSACPRR